MKVSLIATLKDERKNIKEWWESLEQQTRWPDEVVVVDGGSTDGTFEYLQTVNKFVEMKLFQYEGSNIAEGRNRAISLSTGEVIAVTDGGCVLSPHWLENLVTPLEKDPSLQLVAGVYQPLMENWFERLSACVNLPTISEIKADRFLPSSRSIAFRRILWEELGGYPEWLDYGEDMFFNHQWKRRGANYIVAKDALVWWRMRPDLPSLLRQYFRYSWGDGFSGMYPHRHLARFATYAWLSAGIMLLRGRLWFWGATLPFALIYAGRRWRRIPHFYKDCAVGEMVAAALAVPFCLFLVDVAKMAGYLAGWRRRLSE